MTTPFHSREDGGGNAPSLYWKDDIDQTFRVYHLAREIYPRRWEVTSKGDTWDRWFLAHTEISLDNFVEWAKENKLREKWKQDVKRSGYKTRLRNRLKR
jgi:hypothetical protein